jgi:hypothetical protein
MPNARKPSIDEKNFQRSSTVHVENFRRRMQGSLGSYVALALGTPRFLAIVDPRTKFRTLNFMGMAPTFGFVVVDFLFLFPLGSDRFFFFIAIALPFSLARL